MKKQSEELGKITSAVLMVEDHGIFTFSIGFDFGGMHQSFGGYSLDEYDQKRKRRVGHPAGIDLVLQLMALFGVDEFQKLVGRYALALRTDYFIDGVRLPKADGGGEVSIAKWRHDWWPEKYADDGSEVSP